MKFTIITRYYHPTPDGIAHHSAYLNQHLTKLGHSVQVIYDDGIISLAPKEVNLLVNKIQRQQSDWVIFQYNGYSYNRFGAPNWLSDLFKKIHQSDKVKLCLIVHETFIRKDVGLKLKIYRYLQKRTLKIASKYADLLLTTTHLYQEQLSELGRPSQLFFTPSNFEDFIHELQNTTPEVNEIEIGTFGNRSPEFLLEILEILNDKGLVCKFNFIGNFQPKYIKAIKEFTKKLQHINISRSGKLTDRNIVQYLSKLNAFILLEPVSAIDEGGGLNTKSGASATALCMGIPVFSTFGDFTNPAVFKENENYIRLNHQNAQESAEIIYKYLNNRDTLYKIGQEGKKLYDQEFAWSQYVKKMVYLMKK